MSERLVMAKKIRVATVGLGVGRGHVKRLLTNPDAEVVAVCDALEDRLKYARSELGVCNCFTDYERMLKEAQPDAVTTALPNHLHAPFAVKALKEGIHVLNEKPMAESLASAKKMARAAKTSGCILMIRLNYRFNPQSHYLKGMVDKGILGRVYYGRTGWFRRHGIPRGTGWFSVREKAGGGPLIDLGVHRIDMAWWLMGKPEPVAASAVTFDRLMATYRKKHRVKRSLYTTEDLASGLIRFADDSALMVEASWDGHFEHRERMWTHVIGEKGGLVQENVGEGYEFRAAVFTDEGEFNVDVTPHGYPRNLENEIDHFIRAIKEGFEPEGNWRDGLAVQAMLDGLYRSAEAGREVAVKVPEV